MICPGDFIVTDKLLSYSKLPSMNDSNVLPIGSIIVIISSEWFIEENELHRVETTILMGDDIGFVTFSTDGDIDGRQISGKYDQVTGRVVSVE